MRQNDANNIHQLVWKDTTGRFQAYYGEKSLLIEIQVPIKRAYTSRHQQLRSINQSLNNAL